MQGMTQQVQTQQRPKRFFDTTAGVLTILAIVFTGIAVVVYFTQFANPSYEERLRDAELECAELIEFGGTAPDTTKFDACVAYEMGR